MINVELKYKLWGGSWIDAPLRAAAYFEKSGGPFTLDSAPQFDHAYEYLEVDLELIQSTSLVLGDSDSGENIAIRENFWNRGQCFCIEVRGSKDDYYELIINLQKSENESEHIVRLVRNSEGMSPVYHGEFIQ